MGRSGQGRRGAETSPKPSHSRVSGPWRPHGHGGDDARSPVNKVNLPDTCGHCHANPALAAKYKFPVAMPVAAYKSSYHARAILGLPTDELRRKLANRAMVGRLSVREVERLVRQYTAEEGTKTPRQSTRSSLSTCDDSTDQLNDAGLGEHSISVGRL